MTFGNFSSYLSKKAILDAVGVEAKRSATSAVLSSMGLLVLGAATGAAVALLLAPKAGRELRGDIAVKAGEIKGKVDQKIGQLPGIKAKTNNGSTTTV